MLSPSYDVDKQMKLETELNKVEKNWTRWNFSLSEHPKEQKFKVKNLIVQRNGGIFCTNRVDYWYDLSVDLRMDV